MKKRKTYSSGFKTKVVLEALQEREAIQEIGKNMIFIPIRFQLGGASFSPMPMVFLRKELYKTILKRRKQNSTKR